MSKDNSEQDNQLPDVLRRIDTLENQIEVIKIHLNKKDIHDASLQQKLVGLENQFTSIKSEVTSIKTEVISTLNAHSDKTWGLIYKGMQIIIVLVAIVCLMAGVKILPEILKLGGM